MLILVNGIFKTYLMGLTKRNSRGLRQEDHKMTCTSYGFLSLISLTVGDRHNTIRLVFRNPHQPPVSLELESVHAFQIVQEIHQRLEFLVPSYKKNPFLFRIPSALQSSLAPVEYSPCSSVESFQHTLKGYSLAYGLNVQDFQYDIEMELDESASLKLLPPSKGPRAKYSNIHLLTFLRALRDNEYFQSISLANISLDELVDSYDVNGDNHICMKPCIGTKLLVTHEEMKHNSLLIQELSAVALTSPALRRLDLSRTIQKIRNPIPVDKRDDKGSGLMEALYPLWINYNTNVTWLTLSGIYLPKADISFILNIIKKAHCAVRGIELANCHLDSTTLGAILSGLPTQTKTLEAVDLSYNPGMLDASIFQSKSWSTCAEMRKLVLCGARFQPAYPPISIFSLWVLGGWRLEELILDGTPLNEPTVDVLIEYLQLDLSMDLRRLSLVRCQLNAPQMGRLLAASEGHPQLHLDLSENNADDLAFIIESIKRNTAPGKLTLRLLEFREREDFTLFIGALVSNTSIRWLDISGASIAFMVTNDTVSAGIQELFAENHGLEYLNLSGEMSRLDANDFGGEISDSLASLSKNQKLKVLHMERQRLGQKGAQALAAALRQNSTLREIHISNNDIPLAGLVAIIETLKENTIVTHVSRMDESKAAHLLRIQSAVQEFSSSASAAAHRIPRKPVDGADENHLTTTSSRRIPSIGMDFIGKKLSVGSHGRSSSGSFSHRSHQHKDSLSDMASTPSDDVAKVVEDKWATQQTILEEYLLRNRRLRAMSSSKTLADSVDERVDSPAQQLSVGDDFEGESHQETEQYLESDGLPKEPLDLQELQELRGPTALNSPTILVEDVDEPKRTEMTAGLVDVARVVQF